ANTAAGEHSSARPNTNGLSMLPAIVEFEFCGISETYNAFPSARLDVLVHSEKVCRIVLLLDLHQSLECRAVGERDAIGLVLGQKVDVRAVTRERLRLREETTRPLDTARVLRGRLPASVHVHHVIGVPVRVGHCLGCYSAGLSANGSDEDLALGRRQLAGVFDDHIDRAVAELCKVMRLPV